MGNEPQAAVGDILDSPEAGRTVVRGGIWRLGSYAGANVLAVVMAAILLRYLGVKGVARYATVVSLTALVSGVFEAGLGNLGVREAAVLHGAEREAFLRSLLGLRIVVGMAGIVVASALALALGYSHVMVAGVALAGTGILVYTLQTHYATVLQVELRLGQFSSIDLMRQAILTALVGTFVLLDLGLLPLLGATIPTNVVLVAVTVWLVRRSMPITASFAMRRWRALAGRSLAVAAATATGVVYSQIAIVLMSLVSTQAETGLFSASFRIFGVLATIPGILVASVLPILSRAASGSRDRLQAGLQRTCEVSTVLGAGLAALTVVGAPVAIAVVAGSEFDGSIDVLRLHGAALLPTSVIAFAGYGLMSMGRFHTILVCNLVGLLVTSGITIGLGAADGATGAAVGNLAGESTLALLFVIAIVREGFRLQWRIPLLACLAAGAAIGAGLGVPLPAGVQLLVTAVVFVALALSLGLVPSELREALPALPAPLRKPRSSSR
jgi:O-antigen/teichoic acid export membrane protein